MRQWNPLGPQESVPKFLRQASIFKQWQNELWPTRHDSVYRASLAVGRSAPVLPRFRASSSKRWRSSGEAKPDLLKQ